MRLCKLKIGENQVFDYNNSNIPLFHFPFAFRNTSFNEVLIKKRVGVIVRISRASQLLVKESSLIGKKCYTTFVTNNVG